MTKPVELPEPVAYVEVTSACADLHFPRAYKRSAAGARVTAWELGKGDHPLYTTAQLEAYAAEKVREAVELCATTVLDFPHWLGNTGRSEIAKVIRALAMPVEKEQ